MPGLQVSAKLGQGIGQRGEHGGVVRRLEGDDRQVQAQVTERGRGVDGPPNLAVRAEPDMAGQHDLRRVAPNVVAVGMKNITLAGELLCDPRRSSSAGRTGRRFGAYAAPRCRR